MDNLNKRLKYEFKNSSLLELALTHRSASNTNNERLEFFGDAILNFFVSEMLFSKFPNLPEGGLTQLRSSIVRREVLNKIGESLNLSKIMRFGPSEITDNSSIFGNALEAIIGAIYLDSGYKKCAEVMYLLFGEKIDSVDPDEDIRDAKTKLQEYLQKEGNKLPNYEVVSIKSSEQGSKFKVICQLKELSLSATGNGRSRKRAEMAAARSMLRKILIK